VTRLRDAESDRGLARFTTEVAVLPALAVTLEIAGVHQSHVGGVIEADLDHFTAVEMAQIVVNEVHGYLSLTVVFGCDWPCFVVT